MAGEIEAYCNKNQIAAKLQNRIQLVFEETMRLLVPMLESPRIQTVCEYAEAKESAEWTIRYGGPRMDFTRADDDLALAVLKGMTERIEYACEEGATLPNRISLTIRTA